ncbi:GGDEF domain-containing protein [Clostridium tagluense]|uniref:GGDEF domain-containing protein n=1 Tax=Clostridium tagluense TaxID=360422 RepID=UPI001CF5304C|nr:GGDEF domain-containing protein [Clostridium tagluense]MCB2298612.1 GGDEF domain-containing protein [Clostridium tagluense]
MKLILIFPAIILEILNMLVADTVLTRRKSIIYSIGVFILNTLFAYFAVILVEENIENIRISKCLLYFVGLSYMIYIHLIFKESISKKIFTYCSIWMFSTIALFIAVPVSNFFLSIIYFNDIQSIMYIVRTCIQIIMTLLAIYFSLNKYYKKIIDMIPDQTINLMSLYTILAFLMLINNYPTSSAKFTKINSMYDMWLLLIFIILGYILVFIGIYSSSKINLLRYDLEIAKNKAELNYFSANFDALTGIANRANIMKQLIETKELCHRNKQKFALIIFDLDKFKRINDKYGHLVGDEALKYTAQTVQNAIRNTDFVGRFGGDEFIIAQKFIKNEGDVEIVINRIYKELEIPLIIGDKEILINISSGVSIFPDCASDIEILINQADSAMYEGKKRKGCTLNFFKKT